MTALAAKTRFADSLALHPVFPGDGSSVVLAAPAKLNLFLEILRKRPDGYHELESLMVAVDLFDTLEMRAARSDTISLTCEPSSLSAGPDNLVYKAAVALRTYANRPRDRPLGAEIRLTKRIPTQAGLGGGSSDAAAALVGLNEIWKLGLTRLELLAIAASLGSDVAFFLTLPAAWCTGRGEVVTPEEAATGRRSGFDFVLVCPPVGLGTAEVYERLTVPSKPVSGDAIRSAFRAGDAEKLGRVIFNRLEDAAFALEPVVGRIRQRLGSLGPCGAMMSGSGSAVFAVCRDRIQATQMAGSFQDSRRPTNRNLVFL